MMTINAECPEGWRSVRLGDVATLQRGMDLPEHDRIRGKVPVYGANGVHGLHNSAPVEGPGVITGRSGSMGLVHYSQTPFWPLNTTLYVKDFHGNDQRFVYYLLSNLRLERFSASTGVPSLNRNFVHPLPVSIPPLPEQRAIAAVLDSIDDAIERTDAVIAATEQLRDSLLHELLTRGVPGWHSEWKDVPGLGSMPADWEVVKLGDVAETITSGSRAWSQHFRPDGAFFVRSQNIIGGRIDRSDAIWVEPPQDSEAERARICEGDLLISITGEPGKATVADRNLGQAFVSQHVALVRLRDRELSCFTGRFLQSRTCQEQFGRMAYGQTRPGLNLFNVSTTKIALPTLPEQTEIAGVLDGVDGVIADAKKERDGLRWLKESAADALLTGRVQVGEANE